MQASDGNLYGITTTTIFRLTPSGQVSVLYHFDSKKGEGGGIGTLIQAKDGNLYGVTSNPSVIYRISLDGAYKQVHPLSPANQGSNPNTLLQTSDGNLWATSAHSAGPPLIAVTTEGTSVLAMFTSLQVTGGPPIGPLIQGLDGRLYGTTSTYGSFPDGKRGADGTVFVVDAGLPPPASQ